jgi:hypothetical protein
MFCEGDQEASCLRSSTLLHRETRRIIPAMNAAEIWKVAAAVIASIGGGGAIVLGLSGYLGKIWADRGLEKQKQEYAQLNIAFTHQLELASKQVQMELDRLGHLHKLRAESEFQKLGELWKSIARLRFAYSALPTEGYDLQASDSYRTCLGWQTLQSGSVLPSRRSAGRRKLSAGVQEKPRGHNRPGAGSLSAG